MKFFSVLTCLLLLAASAFAYPSGAPNGYAGNPPNYNNCVNCHSSYPLNSGAGYLNITGLPAGGYESGVTYHLTATMDDPNRDRWGFELTPIYQSGSSYLQAGTMAVTDPTNTSLSNGSGTSPDYLKQTNSGTYNNQSGPVFWNFDWTAPDVSTGTLTFYMSGAACNGTGGTSSDYCYTASFPVSPAGGTPNFDITLTYVSGSPVPANGGSLFFDIWVQYNGTTPIDYDAWLAVEYEGGAPTTVVLRPLTNFQPGWAINRPNTSFPVPGAWAAGNYVHFGRVGDEPGTVWNEDSFPWVKSGVSDGSAFQPYPVDGAENPFEYIDKGEAVTEGDYELLACYPNPFNPTTVISYHLQTASNVNLAVYDISGREVATLINGYRNAGSHEITFDASQLPSGIYLAKLTSGDQVAVSKLVLMK